MSTKERILDAALTLFAEYGYDGTSVEQIANLVGIKAPSLYKHYKGKEDILNALIDSAEDALLRITLSYTPVRSGKTRGNLRKLR